MRGKKKGEREGVKEGGRKERERKTKNPKFLSSMIEVRD